MIIILVSQPLTNLITVESCMNREIFIVRTLVTVVLLSSIVYNSYFVASIIGTTDKGYCYDQVGDAHICFENEKLCELSQENDEIAESPCYEDL
jgi:hypothetical protein